MKRCSKCGETKPVSEFNKNNKANDGLYSWCQTCARADSNKFYRANREKYLAMQKIWRQKNIEYKRAYDRKHQLRHGLKSKYGMSLNEYDAMLIRQYRRCAVCGGEMTPPNVDHDHATGAVRGLLCNPCNQAIGFFRDDPDVMRSAIRYIEGSLSQLA